MEAVESGPPAELEAPETEPAWTVTPLTAEQVQADLTALFDAVKAAEAHRAQRVESEQVKARKAMQAAADALKNAGQEVPEAMLTKLAELTKATVSEAFDRSEGDALARRVGAYKGLDVFGEVERVDALLARWSDTARKRAPRGEGRRRPNEGPENRLWALSRITGALDKMPERVAPRGHTYRTPSGNTFHLRTSQAHDRGHGQKSFWVGLAEDKWQPTDLFVLGCGRDALLVVPVKAWHQYMRSTPVASATRVRQPTVWRTTDGSYELRVGGHHVDANQWIDRFDLL